MLEVNNTNFKEEVIESKKPVILDFWAEWCGPCQMMGPVFEELSEEMPEIKFGKVNTEEEQQVPASFNIHGIPTLIVVKDGQEVDRIVGFMSKELLKEKISKILN